MPMIQVFACDHREDPKWILPYVRVNSNSQFTAVSLAGDSSLQRFIVKLSEGAQIWWVYKHLAEFGNPDYVGFCHYRRFFGYSSMPIHDMPEESFDKSAAMSPLEQMKLIEDNSLDGIVPVCFNPLPKTQDCQYSSIAEQTKLISDRDGLGFTTEVVQKAFELLAESAPPSLKDKIQQAYREENIHVCNIFTMKRELFQQYGSIVFSAVEKLDEFVKSRDVSRFHKRWMGYILERFTSSVVKAFIANGTKFGVVPLITLDGWKHEKFEKHVGD